MDDTDNLESALFGSKINVRSSNAHETKKKVTFEEFDHNDPLQDLNLSDDDEFDDSLSNKEPSFNIEKYNKLESLFGIKSDSKIESKDSEPTKARVLNDTETSKAKSPILSKKPLLEKTQSKETVSKESDFLDSSSAPLPKPSKSETLVQRNRSMKALLDDDNDNDFGFPETSKTPPPLSQSKKSSLMEDLFGSRPKSSPSLAEASKGKNIANINLGVTRSNPGESSTAFFNDTANKPANTGGFSLSASREPRRGRRATPALHSNDPLGLLSASSLRVDDTPKIEEKPIQSSTTHDVPSKSAEINDLPEWLGGPKIAKDQKQESEKFTRSETLSTEKSAETFDKTLSSTVIQMPTSEIDAEQRNLTSKLLSMEFDQQTAIINLQQQEHELRTVAALSQQSEKLNYLLETQKLKLSEQEKQFNVLVAKQIERQAMLEAQMKAQQNRIDNYIQTLAAQPTSVPLMHMPIDKNIIASDKENVDEKTESESLLRKLQIEKLYLENTFDSLREKHEREISILEDSYKKQITFLEESMVQMEKRMQDDVECLETDYKLKIKKLKEEIEENEKLYRAEKETLREENQKLVQEIRERHEKSLEILQKEHIETIQRITNSKEIERHAIEIMTVDGTNVENVLNKSQVIIEGLENLEKKFDSRDKNFVESQDKHLSMQERNIEYLKVLLEKQKDEFAEEKQKLMTTVFKLESNTSELIKEFHKQNISFKESEEILKSREQALLRDREMFVDQTNWERERLQAMRETWTKEEERQLDWLAQERQALATERGKLQIFNRLKIGVDESSKFELEATIKAAQEAAASANQERLRWQEKMNELNVQENTLRNRESHLTQKAKELEDFTRAAIVKREEGLKALKEAHFIEERYKEKLNQIKIQEEILTQKESKLAAEKLELARQRLSLRVSQVDEPEKDISVIINNKNNQEDYRSSHSEILSSTQYTTYFKDIVDPHLVMLKWDLDNKLDASSEFPVTNSQ